MPSKDLLPTTGTTEMTKKILDKLFLSGLFKLFRQLPTLINTNKRLNPKFQMLCLLVFVRAI